MKKVILFLVVGFLLIITPLVGADFGPKESLTINFTNYSDSMYVTIISNNVYYGLHIPINEDSNADEIANYKEIYAREVPDEVFYAFLDYVSDDYSLGYDIIKITETYRCGYYPPNNFKVLIYDTSDASFMVSDVYEQYAFSSYYTVDLSKDDIILVNSYDYARETIYLIIRIIVTIIFEILVAILFRIKGKRNYIIIIITNVVTQVLLNVGLNVVTYFNSFFIFEFLLLLFAECIVFVVEFLIYMFTLKDTSNSKAVLYALAANVLSAVTGFIFFLLLHCLPLLD